MNLFQIIPQDLFKPLTSKYKETYLDCLQLIYNTYKTELSFGVDKEIIVDALEHYFDNEPALEMVFDEDDSEVARDSRAKANAILRRLRDSGWIEYEPANDFKTRVNLLDYAATLIESFDKIIRNDEMEYQSLVSQIHATLLNQNGYVKPYEYIIKRVLENTEELMVGFKKLNSNIKKYIDAITNEKSAGEIVQDFFVYQKDIGSKAYHRIKTSDNISHFRSAIIEKLYEILNDDQIFSRAVQGYMEIEQLSDTTIATDSLRGKIVIMISAFRNYDEIISEIDYKHSKYMGSAIARAKFLLTNTNNAEGKIARILAYLSEEFNREAALDLNDELDDAMLEIFNIFPQGFLDSDSLYVMPISRKMSLPEVLSGDLGISDEERMLRKLAMQERSHSRFSRKNINAYVDEILKENKAVLASTLPLDSKRDLIRVIFISLYGRDKKSKYKSISKDEIVAINHFKFCDFMIERSE
ncbi:MAG: hypothetical protein HGA49_03785 [Eubacteriaceae bacterium]|nr:hypothetical protein [Eubacteriaceae bacterium]